MTEILIDYSQIQLQENISLSDAEIKKIEEGQKKLAKLIPTILAFCTLFTMAIPIFCIESFSKFKYYDYILFAAGGLALFGFAYLISFLVTGYDRRNWKKDKIHGKNKLTSIIINRDKTEYGEYLTFAGKSKNDKIRLEVDPEVYARYQKGTKVVVIYLKYSKTAIFISEL
jgi:hypothetical protein